MSDTLSLCLVLIPALPLAATLLTAALGARFLKERSHWPIVAALAGAFVCSLALVREVAVQQRDAPGPAGFERVVTLWSWAAVGDAIELRPAAGAPEAGPRDFRVDVALRADPLTAMMLAMVTFVAALVAIFASGYMQGEAGYWRFFTYFGLFVFSMTMLVSVSNFLLLFVFWEAVGVCSYLLIGFWYHKPEAAAAGKKAFLVNRVGDFGFALALFLIWTTYGTLNYHDTLADGAADPQRIAAAAEAEALRPSQPAAKAEPQGAALAPATPAVVRGVLGQLRIREGGYAPGAVATAICLLLLVGACGKSAQFPLHVWLPDAMEGPTPVSALIHAATMVTAGVYMITRCTPLFMVAPEAQLVVALVGGVTALLAGLIALTQWDLKRVLAYSTVSQLGFMFLGLGAGTFSGVTAGMFHLFTHAFFKALLFLGSGAVMHAMHHIIDMRQFSGLRRHLPYTHATFLVGCLALAGVVPLAGFWSKDGILGAVHDKIHVLEHALEHRHAGAHGSAGQSGAAALGAEHPIALLAGPEKGSASDQADLSPHLTWTDGQLQAYTRIYQGLYYGALCTAFLTAFYTFRAFFLTFYGAEKIPEAAQGHVHESPVMSAPLVVLAVFAAVIGLVFMRDGARVNLFAEFLGGAPSLRVESLLATRGEPEFHLVVAGVSSAAALVGILLAAFLYLGPRTEADWLRGLLDLRGADRFTDPQWVLGLERVWWIGGPVRFLRKLGLGFMPTAAGYLLGLCSLLLAAPLTLAHFITPYKLSYGKFFFDEIYQALLVWPALWLAAILAWIDRWIVDGVVNLCGWLPRALGQLLRSLQMGLVQFYAAAMVVGVLVLLVVRLLGAG